MKAWFCYELSHGGWNPVIYHGSKPDKSVNGQNVERSSLYEVPEELIQDLPFGKLVKMFPRPVG